MSASVAADTPWMATLGPVTDAPHVCLVTGIPGVGKTTVSRLLAEHFERAVHIEADALQRIVVTGRVGPNEELQADAYHSWTSGREMPRRSPLTSGTRGSRLSSTT
jgi:2-phosphoglycerate kinase